mmetsp:Transcript_17036/g.40277  ORF Transcript_17036/g.40277 Transcript_17036/m.40277 type:complete len:348 (+) Transcript_17036:133-1176(+)
MGPWQFLLAFRLALASVKNELAPTEACLFAAQGEIDRSPDKLDMFVTTSRLYKKHLADYFCSIARDMLVLELGVYHGHTTSVLATIFARVISVDIEEAYLSVAAAYNKNHSNVVFLVADLMAGASWNMLASNEVKVIIIDANHDYEHVRADAQNALTYMKQLEYLVFDDVGHEIGVQRTLRELTRAGALKECQGIGHGWDGASWQVRTWNEQTGESFMSWTNTSEGVICKRGNISPAPNFLDKRFYVYQQPLGQLCHAGIMRFLPSSKLITNTWGDGTWRAARQDQRDVLLLQLPGMSSGPVELLFNLPRTGFVLSKMGAATADWFGILDHLIFAPFHLATRQFDDA